MKSILHKLGWESSVPAAEQSHASFTEYLESLDDPGLRALFQQYNEKIYGKKRYDDLDVFNYDRILIEATSRHLKLRPDQEDFDPYTLAVPGHTAGWRQTLAWQTTETMEIPAYDPTDPFALYRPFSSQQRSKLADAIIAQRNKVGEESEEIHTFGVYFSGYASGHASVQAKDVAEAYLLAKLGFEENFESELSDEWELYRLRDDQTDEKYEVG